MRQFGWPRESRRDQLKTYNRKVGGRSRKKRRIRRILVHIRSYLRLKRWTGQIVSLSQTSFL
jgi:hypothetical protein